MENTVNNLLPKIILLFIITIFINSCATPLIKIPLNISKEKLDITLTELTDGPNRYNTGGGYYYPIGAHRFIWATFTIQNKINIEQKINIAEINLVAGNEKIRPYILDMNTLINIKANPEPILKPNEKISRKIIYIVHEALKPEKFIWYDIEIILPKVKIE